MADASGDLRPIPDPTVLTTAQIQREVKTLQTLLKAEHAAIINVTDEKFKAVSQEFAAIERQRVEQKKDTKDAVDAALSAAKEAVKEQTLASSQSIGKSEAATAAALAQLSTTFTTAFDGLRRSIDDLKERVVGIEANKQGGKEAYYGVYLIMMVVAAVAGIVVALIIHG